MYALAQINCISRSAVPQIEQAEARIWNVSPIF
jgi:hypothetical protein